MTGDYPIGTKYTGRNGRGFRVCTVIDVHHTYSKLTGELVKTRYVATHDFCGQAVTDYDVVQPTIARNLISE